MFDNPFDDKSELQKDILQTYDRNPDAGPNEIASICDCSASYVRQTIKEYRGGFSDSLLF